MSELKFQEIEGKGFKVSDIQKMFPENPCPHIYYLKSYYEKHNNPIHSGLCNNKSKENCKQCWKDSLADMRKNYRKEDLEKKGK